MGGVPSGLIPGSSPGYREAGAKRKSKDWRGLSFLNLQPVGDESDHTPHCRGLADASK